MIERVTVLSGGMVSDDKRTGKWVTMDGDRVFLRKSLEMFRSWDPWLHTIAECWVKLVNIDHRSKESRRVCRLTAKRRRQDLRQDRCGRKG